MQYHSILIVLITLCSSSFASPTPHSKHLSGRQDVTSESDRADAVKAAFEYAWNGYKQYAFGHDELKPLSNSFSDSRNGWGASAVDAFTTALVMGESDIVAEILNLISTTNFDVTDTQVSLFETTIRYLGGMLAGYDLLKGPLSNLASDGDAVDSVDALLTQSQRLADNLAYAFDTPTGIPSNYLNLAAHTTDGATTNIIAQIGTLVMEWTRLSDLTGNDTYATLSQKGESYLLNPQPTTSEPWPGLVGTTVDINTGQFQDAEGGWIGDDDSFYEYLLKMYVYDQSRFSDYRDRWIAAADSTIEHLASNPSTRPDITFLAEFNGQERIFQSGHLACFAGGSFLLGGMVLNEQKYKDFGIALTNGCHETYTSDTTGIGPEGFQWVENTTATTDTVNPQPPEADATFYNHNGFWITNSDYILRPEVMESIYYAYRITGDQKYRDWAWAAFQSISINCKVGSGFAELTDVDAANGGSYNDFQDSFLFAEVLKYAYLIHTDDAAWQVNNGGVNDFVFNTEAHPFKVQGPTGPASSY